jgi:hypothetical protein
VKGWKERIVIPTAFLLATQYEAREGGDTADARSSEKLANDDKA